MKYPFSFKVQAPDGGLHTLRLGNSQYMDPQSDYANIAPNGTPDSCSGSPAAVSGTLTYFTTDGTHLRLEVQANGGNGPNTAWTLFLTDGRKVYGTTYFGPATAVVDANNNAVLFASAQDASGNVTNYIVDPADVPNGTNPTNFSQSQLAATMASEFQSGISAGSSTLRSIQIALPNSGPATITRFGGEGLLVQSQVSWEGISVSGTYPCNTQNSTIYCDFQGHAGSAINSSAQAFFSVIKSIELPTGVSYSFSYGSSNPSDANLSTMTLPSGATVSYSTLNRHNFDAPPYLAENPLQSKTVTWADPSDGSTQQLPTTYKYSLFGDTGVCSSGPCSSVTGPDSGVTTQWYEDFRVGGDAFRGLVTKVVLPDGETSTRTWTRFSLPGTQSSDPGNPYISKEVRTLPNGNAATTTYTDDSNGNVTAISASDFTGALIRATTNTYKNTTSYWNAGTTPLLSLLNTNQVSDNGSPAFGSYAAYTYDGSGNQLSETYYDVTGSTILSSLSRTFDGFGNDKTVTDALNHTTTYTYDPAGLCAITVTNALSQQTQNSCDRSSGLLLTSSDPNSIQTLYTYDLLGRLNSVTRGSGAQKQTTSYDDANRIITVRSDVSTFGDLAFSTVTQYDQLGRVTSIQQTDDNGTLGVSKQHYYRVNSSGSFEVESNWYRSAGDQTMGWTVTQRDQRNRVVLTQSYNGSALPSPWGSSTSSTGAVNTAYASNVFTVTDEAGKTRQNTVDAAGRLTTVVEDPTGSPLTTAYTYDSLDNLRRVNQSGQIRSFVYDGLKQLLQAANPESGTVSYGYDLAGNLNAKKDARSITTTYTYDAINRMTGKSYTDGTAAVTYGYDPAVANGKGHLGSVSRGSTNVVNFTSFDTLGHTLTSNQVTGGQTYSFTYAYNASGLLTSETYPSGRIVTTTYDSASRPTLVKGVLSGVQTTYVTQAAYWPHGAPTYYWFGNGGTNGTNSTVPVFEYNSRLQMTSAYATVNNDPNRYLDFRTWSWGTANNNDTLQSASEAIGSAVPSGQLTQINQTYQYDSLNRLHQVVDSGYSWTFGYDSFGNIWVPTGYTGIAPTGMPNSNTYNSSNNQIGSPCTQSGSSYDCAGNMVSVNGTTAAYDAENRQVSITESAALGGGTEQYVYDGQGHRVEKIGPNGTSTVTTVYVYDVFGELAAEYFSGAAATTRCLTCYLFADYLGTPHLVTDQNGNIVARHDYLPFGGEILGGQAGRNAEFGPSGDIVAQKFTGKERDTESGLDYFGFRYYGSALGRWTSPDVLNITPDRLLNPSRMMNKYVYGANNPLSLVDLDGRDVTALVEPPHGLLPGHFMLFANNPKTGESGLMSFGPVDSSNSGRFFTALNGPMSSTNQYDLPRSADDLRNNFAALTIQTTPEQAQAVLDFIKNVSANTPEDWYRVLSENCTTVCRDAAKAVGILPPDSGNITPFGLWSTLFQKYAKNPTYSTFSSLPYPSPSFSMMNIQDKKGVDYGNPRFGMNTFDFIMLQLKPNCTDTWDPNTNTLHGCH